MNPMCMTRTALRTGLRTTAHTTTPLQRLGVVMPLVMPLQQVGMIFVRKRPPRA